MKNFTVISLDIWDTLLKRVCTPDEIKWATSRFFYFSYLDKLNEKYRSIDRLIQLRKTSESAGSNHTENDEYELRAVLSRMVEEALTGGQQDDAIIDCLYQFELNQEIICTYLNTRVEQKLQRRPYDSLIYVSDFYGDEAFIGAILRAKRCPYSFDRAFISCQYGCNKSNGSLFEQVLLEMKLSGKNILHIGDNLKSDVAMPLLKGFHVSPFPFISIRKTLLDFALRWRPTRDHINKQLIGKRLSKGYNANDNVSMSGSRLGPVFFQFVLWIMECCKERRIKKIYYFTREGEFFRQIHNEISSQKLYGIEWPQSELLEVSRIATFLPSLQNCTIEEMRRLWAQYPNQSFRTFINSLSLPVHEVMPYIIRHNIEIDVEVCNIATNKKISQLFQDTEFCNYVMRKAANARELLEGYLHQKGICDTSGEIAIVDIGWRGTIQDNISYILPNTRVFGYYLGLLPFINKQPPNSIKAGFLNCFPNYRCLIKSPTPLEFITNSPNGSIVAYRRTAEGAIRAVRHVVSEENTVYIEYTEKLQNAILKNINELCHMTNQHSTTQIDFSNISYRNLYRFFLYPEITVSQAFFKLVHNEEYGLGRIASHKYPFPWKLLLLAPFRRATLTELRLYLNQTLWPQAFFSAHSMSCINYIYNIILKAVTSSTSGEKL